MKTSFTTLLLLLFTTAVFSQQLKDTSALTATDYLQKSKRQKTTAWILTTAGTAGLLTTLMADASQAVSGAFVTVISVGTVEPEYKSYTGYYLLSIAALAGGITYFISAGNNKKRARALQTTFKMEHAPLLQTNSMKDQAYPAVGITLSL